MDTFLAVAAGIIGVILFGRALYRARHGRTSPITYAVNFVQAIALLALALGVFAVVPFAIGLWTSIIFNIAGSIMLSAHKDPNKTGAVISGSI